MRVRPRVARRASIAAPTDPTVSTRRWPAAHERSGSSSRRSPGKNSSCSVASRGFAHRADGWEAASERTLVAEGIPVERLDSSSAAQLYPTFGGDDLAFVLYEPDGGVLRAERSMKTLAAQAVSHGARIVRGRARPDGAAVVLEDSTHIQGDVVIWACGPWLPKLLPDLVSLRVTQQEVLFFDGGSAWRAPDIPVWVDYDQARCGTADIDEPE